MQQVADENGLEMSQSLPGASMSVPAVAAKDSVHDELGERLAKLRG
jgi:hypothetical protein